MKRVLMIVATAVVILCLLGAGVVYSWTFTPQGRLDPEIAILRKMMSLRPSPETLPVEQVRQSYRRSAELGFFGSQIPLSRVEDRGIPRAGGSIPARVYWPSTAADLPLVVYYHGGGFTIGDLVTHDNICRRLARDAGAVVVSVDYRLAPEHSFPAAPDDAYDAVLWAAEHARELGARGDLIAVAGDSAGGNLAAVTALRARDRGKPAIIFQLLVYPRVDLTGYETQSWRDLDGFFLSKRTADFFRNAYIPDARNYADPYASPLLAPDHRGLPPALVITAEFDPLRDEGEAYARKLATARVPARSSRYPGVIHGFLGLRFCRKSDLAFREVTAALRDAFRKKS